MFTSNRSHCLTSDSKPDGEVIKEPKVQPSDITTVKHGISETHLISVVRQALVSEGLARAPVLSIRPGYMAPPLTANTNRCQLHV